ncbi:hypothetical protein BJY01DRAFT_7857 [Aspergillus pseudoustus]|uniref:Uncharacterized protein n=1 Tax=Aspergillus pseudoustus TaxID=1810923 RepID=A0ABR4JNU8_9EURO
MQGALGCSSLQPLGCSRSSSFITTPAPKQSWFLTPLASILEAEYRHGGSRLVIYLNFNLQALPVHLFVNIIALDIIPSPSVDCEQDALLELSRIIKTVAQESHIPRQIDRRARLDKVHKEVDKVTRTSDREYKVQWLWSRIPGFGSVSHGPFIWMRWSNHLLKRRRPQFGLTIGSKINIENGGEVCYAAVWCFSW